MKQWIIRGLAAMFVVGIVAVLGKVLWVVLR